MELSLRIFEGSLPTVEEFPLLDEPLRSMTKWGVAFVLGGEMECAVGMGGLEKIHRRNIA
jgi:hypothetical protein